VAHCINTIGAGIDRSLSGVFESANAPVFMRVRRRFCRRLGFVLGLRGKKWRFLVGTLTSKLRETYDSKMGENEMDLVSAFCNPDPRSVNIPDSLGPMVTPET